MRGVGNLRDTERGRHGCHGAHRFTEQQVDEGTLADVDSSHHCQPHGGALQLMGGRLQCFHAVQRANIVGHGAATVGVHGVGFLEHVPVRGQQLHGALREAGQHVHVVTGVLERAGNGTVERVAVNEGAACSSCGRGTGLHGHSTTRWRVRQGKRKGWFVQRNNSTTHPVAAPR